MAGITETNSWREELASLVDDGIRYTSNIDPFITSSPIGSKQPHFDFDAHLLDSKQTHFNFDSDFEEKDENLKDQIKGFAKAWGELLLDLSRGCKDIVKQNLVSDDSYFVQKFGPPLDFVSKKLSFLNNFLPEDRDPFQAWSIILFVFVLAIAVLNGNSAHDNPGPAIKKMVVHPLSASTILLPDGRYIAYNDQGVAGRRARYTIISPHTFLSSRLAGIPGISASLLKEFGIRLVTYDLPGFGESDPHPSRDLNTSALDVHYLAN